MPDPSQSQLPDQTIPSPEEAAEHLLDDASAVEGDVTVPSEPDAAGPAETEEVTPEELGLELPVDPDETRRILLRELAFARAEADEYLDNLRRLAADFENYRKRVERDQVENVKRASERIVAALLPVLDSFDAAFAFEAQTPAEEKLLEGFRSTYQQLLDALRREGLEVIPAVGRPFDPAIHEAVAAPAGGDGELVVVEELRRGYMLHDRVIRPALVRVDHEDDA